MTGKDADRFAAAMMVLSRAYDVELDDARVTIYFRDLSQFPIEAVEQACAAWRRQGGVQFFPRINELRPLCRRYVAKVPEQQRLQAPEGPPPLEGPAPCRILGETAEAIARRNKMQGPRPVPRTEELAPMLQVNRQIEERRKTNLREQARRLEEREA